MNNLSSYYGLTDSRMNASERKITCNSLLDSQCCLKSARFVFIFAAFENKSIFILVSLVYSYNCSYDLDLEIFLDSDAFNLLEICTNDLAIHGVCCKEIKL